MVEELGGNEDVHLVIQRDNGNFSDNEARHSKFRQDDPDTPLISLFLILIAQKGWNVWKVHEG